MRSVKVYLKDTECCNCHRKENRKRAEAEDWVEIVYVDQTGMSVSKDTICQMCAENWNPDYFTTTPAAVAPTPAVSPTPVIH